MESVDFKLSNQLCFSVYEANRLFAKFYQQALSDFSLTYPQYLVLLALWENDHQKVRQLAASLHLASNTLTPLLKRLERAGWLKRTRSQYDQRELIVALSQKGWAEHEAVEAAVMACVEGQPGIQLQDYQQMLQNNQQLIKTLRQLVD